MLTSRQPGGGAFLALTGGTLTGKLTVKNALQVTGDIGVGASNTTIVSGAVEGQTNVGGVLFSGDSWYLGNIVSTGVCLYADMNSGLTVNEPDVDMVLNENTGVFRNFEGRCRKAGSTLHFEYEVITTSTITSTNDPLVASFGPMQGTMIPNQATGVWYCPNVDDTTIAQSGIVYWNTTGSRDMGIYLSAYSGSISANREVHISIMWNMTSMT